MDDSEVIEPAANPANGTVKTVETAPAPENRGINWLNALASIQHLKELLVILVAIYVVWKLLDMLRIFIGSLSATMLGAANLYSAPIAVMKSIDWHVLLLGTALIVALAAIVIVMLKNVLAQSNERSPSSKSGDGLNVVKDMPLGEFVAALWSIVKPKG